ANREAFARQVAEAVGEPLEVLASEEEARLTVRGVQGGLGGLPAEGVLFDIGGGSTEFIGLRSGQPTRVVSLPVGVVKGREAFLPHDPVEPEAIRALTAYFIDAVTPVKHTLQAGSTPQLIGTAGTVTTLAAIDQGLVKYEPALINAHVLTEAAVARLLEELSAMTIEQRRAIPVMEPGREDVIVAGVALTQVILEVFESSELLVSEYGLREGLVLELLVD
ncbi:MAG: Ppx/GppA family phosphatase, partial [Nitrospinota bacterium]